MANRPGTRGRILDDEFDFSASDLTKQFEQLLRTQRLNELEEQAEIARRQRSSSPAVHTRPQQPPSQPPQPQIEVNQTHLSPQSTPPSYKPHRTAPLVPCAPQDAQAMRFRNYLHSLSITPTKYENPGLLDEALTFIPIDKIYTAAEEEHDIMKGIAASISETAKPEWGYQDCVIRALLRWFKREFFEFVTNPKCSRCQGPTLAQGGVAPTPDEAARGATKAVELYKCAVNGCNTYERFPRYSDVWTLLETRRGRAGEFANCFGMLCRAAGARVRWVWNSEDSVWNEVYSVHQKRWVHVDACEEQWDNPRIYTEGWGRKLAYCVGFSSDGACDVTRRYVRDPAVHGLARTRCSEETLLWIMLEIRKVRREITEKDQRRVLLKEDEREDRELQRFVANSIAAQMISSFPGARTPQQSEDVKTPIAQPQAQHHHTQQLDHGHGVGPHQDGR